jgi:hypothetical protein
MRRITIVFAVLAAAAMTASVALAAITTTINPANAPTGAHFAAGTSATCSVTGATVDCSSYQVAGVGNANATGALNATYTATVLCSNSGTNPNNSVEAQTKFSSQPATTGNLNPKNGKLTVPPLSTSPPTSPPAGSCPNPNWTASFRTGKSHTPKLHVHADLRRLHWGVHHHHRPVMGASR